MNIFYALYGFLLVPILIRHFGKAEYGLIGIATSVNAYMQLMDMGLHSTNIRFFSNWLAKGYEIKVRKLFSTCSAFYGCVGLLNGLVLLIVYFFSDTIFHVTPEQCETLDNLLLILIVSAFVNWFTSCYNQIIQATENVAWTQKRQLLTKVLMAVVLGVTVLCDLTVTEYFVLTVLSNWIILPLVVKKIKEVAPMVNFKPTFDKQVFKEILPYSLNMFSYTIFSFSYRNLKPVFLGVEGSPEDVTDYQVIMGVVGICSAVSSVFQSALLPSSSKAIARNDEKTYYRIAYQGTKYITMVTVFCVFGLLSIDKSLLILYVGEDFLCLLPALNLTILTLLHNHILGISSLIIGGGNIRPLSIITAITSVLSLILCWILIPQYKTMGVTIATVAFTIGNQLFFYTYYFPKRMKIDSWRIFSKTFMPTTLLGAIVYWATLYVPTIDNHWINVITHGTAFAVLFIATSFFILGEEDKQFAVSLIKRRKDK